MVGGQTKRRIYKVHREQKLLELIREAQQGNVLQNADFGVVYMNYNCDGDGRPIILDDEHYHPDVAVSFVKAIND